MLIPAELICQELSPGNFRHYTTEDGLSNNTIFSITQDQRGYVWIGSASGLTRYNGSRFVHYRSNTDSLSLPSDYITGMVWLNKDQLAANNVGVHVINTRTGETRNLFIPYHDKRYQFKFNMVERIRGDDEGNIFVLTRSGFYHFDKDYKLASRFDYYSEKEVPTEHFYFGREVIELDKRYLLIVSVGGLYLYDREKKEVRRYKSAEYPLLAEFEDYPRSYFTFFQHKPGELVIYKFDSDSIIYVNTAQNKKVVSRLPFKPDTREFHYRSRLVSVNDSVSYLIGHLSGFYEMQVNPTSGLIKMDPEKHFSTYQCNSILRDKDQNLWVATDKGLFKQDPATRQVQVTHVPSKLVDSYANLRLDDIYASSDKIYAGSRGSAGLLIFDKRSLQFRKQIIFKTYQSAGMPTGNHIDAILALDTSTLLLGTDWPLLKFDRITNKEKKLTPPSWQDGDWTNDLFRDSKGNIWISAFHIYKYNASMNSYTIIPGPAKLLTVPFGIEEDQDGNIWMTGHGLARYNTSVDSFDLFLDSFPYIKMMDKQVNSMVIDKQNTVWFNSNNNGLTGYDINKKTFRQFTRSNGLPDDNIASMIVVGNKLWMACFTGMACMDIQNFIRL